MKKAKQPAAKAKKVRKGLHEAAGAFAGFRPAREVLREVRAVKTRFVQFDHATKVGGLPIERFTLLSGPSNEGKTALGLGLLGSFVQQGHFGMLIDAERTTPMTWARQLIGAAADNDRFLAMRPGSYEETVRSVRHFVLELKRQKDAGQLHSDTSALIVCDSIRKLVPEGLLEKIMKEARDIKGVDGMGGRGAQIKAALNAQWLDELVPLLEETGTAFLCLTREVDDPDADVWTKRAGNDFKTQGGKALFYDASLALRVERYGYVQEKFGEGDSQTSKVYGERHRVTIRKTKIAGREDRQTVCYFHTSNGVLYDAGFDRGRDLIELGLRLGVVQQSGSWFSFAGNKIGNGLHAAAKNLHQDGVLAELLDSAVRGAFGQAEPIEFDADGVVTS